MKKPIHLFLSIAAAVFLTAVHFTLAFAMTEEADSGYEPHSVSNVFNFSATLNNLGKVETSWDEYIPEGFDYYKLIRSVTNQDPVYPDDGYIFYGGEGETSYTDTEVPKGTSYYRVCSIAYPKRICSPVVTIEKGGEAAMADDTDKSSTDENGYEPRILSQAFSFTASLNSLGKVETHWNEYIPANFNYYKVIRSQKNSDPIYPDDGNIFAGGEGETSYTDKNVPEGTTYYRVCAIAKPKRYCSRVAVIVKGSDKAEGGMDEAKQDGGAYEAPVIYEGFNFSASLNSLGKVETHWNEYIPEGFNYYKLIRSISNPDPIYPDDGYIFVGNEGETSYLDTGIPGGFSYYRVCSIAESKRYCSPVVTIDYKEDYADVEKYYVPTLYEKEAVKKEVKKATPPSKFKDVTSHWSKTFADKLKDECSIYGFKNADGEYLGEFRPDEPITRAELVKMLTQCKFGGDLAETSDDFYDVSQSAWYAPAVYEAKKLGWVKGYSDGSFKPNATVNRAEALKMILLSAFSDADIKGGFSNFSDVSSQWFKKYIQFAVMKGYVQGYNDGRFGPGNQITRGEAAKIIAKAHHFVASQEVDQGDVMTKDEKKADEMKDTEKPSTTNGPVPMVGSCQIFPADNPWNADVSKYPVHQNSDNYINTILSGANTLHPDFGSDPDYGIPWMTVDSSQPKAQISAYYEDESDLPAEGYPIPSGAEIEAGSDGHILVIDTDACKLYETFDSNWNGSMWEVGSGAIFDLNSNALRPDGWTSADAAGLPIFPGLVRYDEVKSGEINHALRFTVSKSQQAYIHPATHYASSSTDPNRPPMGLRLRLKADFDLSGYTGDALVILKALKKYGMIVADNGSDWFITGETNTKWDDEDLGQLKSVPGSAFEAVYTGEIVQ